jgi:ribose transport system ATP-binding protein
MEIMKTILSLRMENISKSFPGVKALENIYLDIHKGEVLVLIGENGAGKSTLMKILSGVYSPDSGLIYMNDSAMQFKSARDANKAGIRMIFQELNLVPTQTIVQNIFLGREPKTKRLPFIIDIKKMKEEAALILDSIGLELDPFVKISDLSVAQQQMVAIAKAVSSNAQIIIMDEPTAALTEKEIEKLFCIIKSLKEKGISVIYISHRLQEVHRVGDRCMVLRNGKCVGTEQLSDVTVDELINMMVGDQSSRIIKREIKEHKSKEILRLEGIRGSPEQRMIKVFSGEIVGIAGVVGSGRTELAEAIFGISKLPNMKIFFEGKRVVISSPKKAIKIGIGLLPEDRRSCGLFLSLSYCENIVSALQQILSRYFITSPSLEKKMANKYKQELNINTPSLGQIIKLLSGGNQQKTVIGKWLCSKAKLLIFDDPTRGVDVGARREVYQLMNRLTEIGAAIMMISSDLSELLDMSDRIYVMNKGMIVSELTREEANYRRVFEYATQQI